MLQIHVDGSELFDESTQTFVKIKPVDLKLEHSLVSISKWESKYHKPFMSKEEKTNEEVIFYIECMTLTQNVDPIIFKHLSQKNIEEIGAYISDPMTATTFSNKNKKSNNRIITSELIYYWMIEGGVPVEFQKWHISRLLTLLEVISAEREPDNKKMSSSQLAARNAALNAQRRAKLHTKG